MKTRLLRSSLLGLLALVAAQLAGAQSPTQRTVRYTVTDLGTLGGPGTNSSAFDNNNAGWVAGSGNLTSDGPQHAFVWYGRGPLIDTGTLGGPNSEADGPNLWDKCRSSPKLPSSIPMGRISVASAITSNASARYGGIENSTRFQLYPEAAMPKYLASTIWARPSDFPRRALRTLPANPRCRLNCFATRPRSGNRAARSENCVLYMVTPWDSLSASTTKAKLSVAPACAPTLRFPFFSRTEYTPCSGKEMERPVTWAPSGEPLPTSPLALIMLDRWSVLRNSPMARFTPSSGRETRGCATWAPCPGPC